MPSVMVVSWKLTTFTVLEQDGFLAIEIILLRLVVGPSNEYYSILDRFGILRKVI